MAQLSQVAEVQESQQMTNEGLLQQRSREMRTYINKDQVLTIQTKISLNQLNIGFTSNNIQAMDPEFLAKMMQVLNQFGYQDIKEIGKGTFGVVLRANTKEGQLRAIKIQIIKGGQENLEFKVAKLVSDEGNEKCFGDAINIYRTFTIQDKATGLKMGIIEMELAETSLQSFLEGKQKNKKDPITDEQVKSICVQLIKNLVTMHNTQ